MQRRRRKPGMTAQSRPIGVFKDEGEDDDEDGDGAGDAAGQAVRARRSSAAASNGRGSREDQGSHGQRTTDRSRSADMRDQVLGLLLAAAAGAPVNESEGWSGGCKLKTPTTTTSTTTTTTATATRDWQGRDKRQRC
jgi:hypothetical protein